MTEPRPTPATAFPPMLATESPTLPVDPRPTSATQLPTTPAQPRPTSATEPRPAVPASALPDAGLPGVSASRRAALAANAAAVRARVEAACVAAGRDPGEVTIIAVTKTFPAADVAAMVELGFADVAENREQELATKVAALAGRLGADAAGAPLPRWHFVGRLQTNKARSVGALATVMHSCDRVRLVPGLGAGARQAGRVLDVLVQVSLDPPDAAAGRGGCPPADVPALAAAVAGEPGLRLRGVMAVAPLGGDPDEAFARLADLAADLRERHPSATWVSAGMSGDLESAVRHGATHLRLGAALLGGRGPVK